MEFGDKNPLFYGPFYQYNPPESKDKTEVKNAKLFVTNLRRNALLKIVKELKDNYKEPLQIYVFDGPQGIGKTYNLLIFSDCLRKVKNVKLVHIQQSENLNDSFKDVILDQFYFTFPEEKEFFDQIKNKNVQKMLNKLEELLIKYKRKGYILILIVDQLNYLKDTEKLKKLISLGWNIFFGSQSANNIQNAVKNWKYMYDSVLFSEKKFTH